jgi:hypothetical protein
MADPITITAVLIPIAQNLFSEGLVRTVDNVRRRTPTHKAIRSTAEKFDTRASDLSSALERWCQSEPFIAEAENIGGGRPGATDAEHVDLFIAHSGLQNGAVSFELARDILLFFYTELYSEMCASSDGSKVIGLQVLAANQKLDHLLAQSAPLSQPVSEPYSVRPELDTVKRALTTEDREAEIQLDLLFSCYRIYSRKSTVAPFPRLSVLAFSSTKAFATLSATSRIWPFWSSSGRECWTRKTRRR